MKNAFMITIPHSGEAVPSEIHWLQGLPETTLMRDVDRFVDKLYKPALDDLQIIHIKTQWHRYFADLNRTPEDVDQNSVIGSTHPPGTHTTGLHWVKTTWGETLMSEPISSELHTNIVNKYFKPFHDQVLEQYKKFRDQNIQNIFHLDAHSMPSKGTDAHRDPGENRSEIVISDQDGSSCINPYKELVIEAYEKAGLQVGYNWPYKGGRLTQTYGKPEKNQQVIQVEINRKLYMNEETKKLETQKAAQLSKQLKLAVEHIYTNIEKL